MSTLVVIPTYNEADSIAELLGRVRGATADDVLIVDDNSPDGTADLVRAHPDFGTSLHLLCRPGKAGLGAAYRAGFAWGFERGYTVLVQMDADLSHPPESIPALVAAVDPAVGGTADLAIGSRYVPGGNTVNWPKLRQFISWAGNFYVRMVLALKTKDSTAGFRAYRAGTLEEIGVLDSTSNGYCFQVENTWRSARLGLGVREIPITFTERAVGTSKMSGDIVREAVWRVLVWRFQELTGRGVVRRARQGGSAR